MISKKLFRLLEHRWAKYGYVYSTEDRVLERLKNFNDNCKNLLKGKDVVELACNAGIFGYVITEVANSYTGIEPNSTYIKQAEMTSAYSPKKFNLINKTAKGFFKNPTEFNALVANFSLYRFTDKEIKLIENALTKCDVVIAQNRTVKIERKVNAYNFRGAKVILKWLRGMGFHAIIIWGDKAKSYCTIVGVK